MNDPKHDAAWHGTEPCVTCEDQGPDETEGLANMRTLHRVTHRYLLAKAATYSGRLPMIADALMSLDISRAMRGRWSR